jgi:hypothetical protein
MTEALALWRQVADGFSQRLREVRSDDWSLPTCCDRWDVTKLVDHAIGAQRMVPKALGDRGHRHDGRRSRTGLGHGSSGRR